MPTNDQASAIEAIYDALDAGDAERALRLARDEIDRGQDDAVIRFLAGVALLELGSADEAASELARAVESDPDDAEFRARHAVALYHACRLDAARVEARAALRADDGLPDAHEAWGLLLELDGRFEEADRHLERAHRLDPERFPAARRLSRADFEAHVREAAERLPEHFRRHLDEVAVTVEPVPPPALLADETAPLDPGLLGLFVGVSLADRTHFSSGGELPPRIYLFQRSLERYAAGRDDLDEQIAITLYHELGHYLGLDEDELADIELA